MGSAPPLLFEVLGLDREGTDAGFMNEKPRLSPTHATTVAQA